MLTRLLEELGLFVGAEKLPFNLNESTFFFRLNEWLLQQVNASWDNVYNYQFMDEFIKEKVHEILLNELGGPQRKKYLGRKQAAKYRDIRDLDFSWGWKDPRNTFTADVWKTIFPYAKFVHIYRNPIDVAQSLRVRELLIRESLQLTIGFKILKLLNYKVVQTLSSRVLNIKEGITLWSDYVERAFSLEDVYGQDNIIHVRYESFLEAPEPCLKDILEFIDLSVENSRIKQVIQMVDPGRKFAFIHDERLVEHYEQIKNQSIMEKLKYHSIV